MQNAYGFGKTVSMSFDDAVARVTAALATEGFGILTEIDVAATMKKKLDHDMPPYRILGACNPPFARQAIEAEPTIGLLLPCNVVVRQDGPEVLVEAIDPVGMMSVAGDDALDAVAGEAAERLGKALDSLTAA